MSQTCKNDPGTPSRLNTKVKGFKPQIKKNQWKTRHLYNGTHTVKLNSSHGYLSLCTMSFPYNCCLFVLRELAPFDFLWE